MKAQNEYGLTLVEILASLVILGIVFIGFMTIFPQMNAFNQKTETKLLTMNVAKQELTKIKDSKSFLRNANNIKQNSKSDSFESHYIENDAYRIEVECHEKDGATCSSSWDTVRETKLHLVHIKVYNGGKLNSETFGYIEL